MPGKNTKKRRRAQNALLVPEAGDRHLCPPNTRSIHGRALPGQVYRTAVTPLVGEQLERMPDPSAWAQTVIADMAPRDPAEEMLVAQLLFAHARVMRLTQLANIQSSPEYIRVMHEYADRASNTYRRLMLALAEYRRPPRTGDTFAVVKQTNIAGQQLIQNHEISSQTTTNEQGCRSDAGNPRSPTAGSPALSAHPGGSDFPAGVCPPREALDPVHRSPDAQRQGPIASQRDEAR